jgi:threonyl-tRNA synthetase
MSSSQPNPRAPERRSHRWLGEQLDLFHFPAHSIGMASWHPRGVVVYDALAAYGRELNARYGYQEVRSPLVCDIQLWERSGHQEKFAERMFQLGVDGRPAALKPMNCPGHCDLFALRPRSYRELPLRIAELGHVHRLEQPGELNGLLRARSFVIDDGHVFCAPAQVAGELIECLRMAQEVYELFGLALVVELSLRPEQRLGDDRLWDRAEADLRDAVREAGLSFEERPGEGAFYGPKVDLHISDALGRSWQMGSVQLDFQLPLRFDLRYVDAGGSSHDPEGNPHRPVLVHRALFGSYERFMGVLIEHYDGRFPLWLAPEAVRLLPVGGGQAEYAQEAAGRLADAGVRCAIDGAGPLDGRIREAHRLRIPLVAIVGASEMAAEEIALRRPGRAGQARESMRDAVAMLRDEVAERRSHAEAVR